METIFIIISIFLGTFVSVCFLALSVVVISELYHYLKNK